MKRAPVLGLVTLGALALGVGMWRASSDRRGAVGPETPASAADRAWIAPRDETSMAAVGEVQDIPAESNRSALGESAPAGPREPGREDAARRWLEGIVIFPPGTPADEQVTVYTTGADPVPVGRDGRFRIPVPEPLRATMTGGDRTPRRGGEFVLTWSWHRLSLAGRYLWLAEDVRWDEETLGPVTLRPILGGRIEGLVRSPLGLEPDGAVELRSGQGRRPPAVPGPDSAFAFDAVDAAQPCALSYEGSTLFGSVTGLRVQPGRTSVVDLFVGRGIALAGRVRDEAGRPVPRLEVTALVTHDSGTSQRADATDSDGAFRIEGVAPGEIRVEARRSGRLRAWLELGELAAGERREDLELVLENAGSIAGRVLWPDGAPAQAWITLAREAPESPEDKEKNPEASQTDAEGRFRLTDIRGGPFLVKAATSRVIGGRTTRWRAEVPHVQPDAGEITLTLVESTAVRGRVLVEGGALGSRFAVSAQRPLAGPDAPDAVGSELRGSFDSADGSFLLTGFAPGEWELRVQPPEGFYAEPARVRVPTSAVVELWLRREASVRGLVLDERGLPAAGAWVLCAGGRDGLETGASEITAEDGAFALRSLPPGPATFTVMRQDVAVSEPQVLELAPGVERTDVVLYLSPARAPR